MKKLKLLYLILKNIRLIDKFKLYNLIFELKGVESNIFYFNMNDNVWISACKAVRPGMIVLDDNNEMAELLFQFINFIVHDMITQLNSINKLYLNLLQGV